MNKRDLGYKKSIYLVLVFAILFSLIYTPNNTKGDSPLYNRGEVMTASSNVKDDVKVSLRLWELLFGKSENKSESKNETNEVTLLTNK